MRQKHPIWKKLLLALSSLVLTVVGFELSAHVWDYAQYGVRKVDGQPQGLYIRDGNPEPRLQPGAHLSGLFHSISVNAHAMRGPEITVPEPANTTRVWCVGGSTTFDIFASDNTHTWPAVAQRYLTEALQGRNIELLNGGVPGDILEGSARKLATHGRPLGVDYVLIYHGPNDMRAASGGHFVIPDAVSIPLRSLALLQTWAQGRGLGSGELPDRAPTSRDRQTLLNRLDFLERTIRSMGLRPIYATHALRIAPTATGATLRQQAGELPVQLQMSPLSTRDWYDMWNGLMRERAEATQAPLVDVRAAVGPDPSLWGDATHFSDAGSERAGRAVADALAAYFRRK